MYAPHLVVLQGVRHPACMLTTVSSVQAESNEDPGGEPCPTAVAAGPDNRHEG